MMHLAAIIRKLKAASDAMPETGRCPAERQKRFWPAYGIHLQMLRASSS